MVMIRKLKAVVFNLADPDQKIMFEHADERTNFSAYVKRLIQRDIEGGNNLPKRAKKRGSLEGMI